ncbi:MULTISPECIES: SpoIIE family protein phosphatase [unclassified Oceanobacter]|jgi:serine phosphatase RsbU (regulator of sigma subunit)|uniref:SpoIIE family protein phosphatase n=1 Tax=unclassified Oceanobacter TaxID=2620260 RepID=UPI0026E17880|nr:MULTISPECIES: SpoIIE family protein phosphatase [unclassified Oceanobacter]MDO6681119.1 response regulator [Oceanobacter sp. 5_MG-2023]MDP2504309.1 response regulator [Oceanobacter sp. 3_MG-2023]MDP2608513.1 response regulator [Oceanobacter sp. 1_MG-2023]MDP2611725.1 response regulator [Oceanobacter sp. 2_MG-2023]
MAANVLVIDDDPSVLESIATFLVEYDYQVVAAPSAVAAWKELDRHHIDIVVCDLRMPDTSGIEWLEQLKQRWPSLPVIVVSGGGVMDDVVQALRMGADDFLVKPILDLEMLHHAIKRALERVELETENTAYREYLEKTNAELRHGLEELRTDQMAGRQIQMRMLPDSLNYNGLCCDHRIFPSLMLSGDFLDYFELGEHRLVFYIADVSGHGSSSAFVTVLLKNLTYRLRRNYRRGSSDDLLHPSQVLSRMNDEMLATGLDKHLTIFYGILDTRESVLEYSVGGHLPMPALLDASGCRYLEGQGMPVGLFREAEYTTRHLELPSAFRLLLFSDGVLEIITEANLAAKEKALLGMVEDQNGDLDGLTSVLGLGKELEVPDDIAMVSIGRGKL